jgi:hypothetical protein
MDYTHKGVDSAWPGGPYTNYVRVYVPLGTNLAGLKMYRDGSATADISESVSVYEDLGRTVFAFSFVLEPSEEVTFEAFYDLPERLSFSKEEKQYSLYWQKQPGTLDDTFRFGFKGPFSTEITTYSPADIGKEQNVAVLEGLLNSDKEIGLILK